MNEKIINEASDRIEKYAWGLTHPWNTKLLFVNNLNSLLSLTEDKDDRLLDINTNEYENVRDFITNCKYFSVLSFDMQRHSFNSLDEFESILPPLIILYSVDGEIQVNEDDDELSFIKETENLFNLRSKNFLLKAKYIIGSFEFSKGGTPKKIMHAEDFLLSDSLENLENSSFYKMSLHCSENIYLGNKQWQILLSDENRIIELNLENILNNYTKNSFYTNNLVKPNSIEYHNNTIVLTGEHFHEGYLKESHYASSIWFEINRENIIHIESSNSNYNGR